ncbi:hypothetical protein ACFFQW_30875 [Umezawaea endophytica]|uniref:Uncharacterized protein n=1 Tax=Umezawaea endophytica TaxID=1654476 RepID=A0A9X3AKB8_9PSEU|nr:hypothetical protein [Umezawaea endophytica]MCS7482655.1 hypothetical protein [Umezawaea endophytica]
MTQPPAVPPEPLPPYGQQPQWGPPPGGQYGPPPGQYGPPPAPPRSKKPKRWPWIVVGVIAVLVVISAANDGLRSKREPDAAAGSSSAAPAELAKAPTTSVAPPRTTTRTTTTTTTPPPPPPTVYTGQGDDVLTLDRPSGLKIVKFECPACTSNTTLKSDGFESLLVNEIGAYSGLRWMDIRDGSRTTTLTVGAEGAWTVTVGGLELAPLVDGVATGTGDSVVFLTTRSTKAKIGNVGDGNFAVHVVSLKASRVDLAVNTIGGYDGTVPLAGPAIVQITSSGDWSVTPS